MLYLTPEDFFINQNKDLCNRLAGYSFIMFSSRSCTYCKDIHPSFSKLSQMIQGCNFAIMDVEQQNQRVVGLSQQSKTSIEYVPFLLLYANGQPLAQYMPDETNPDANVDKMTKFLVEQTNKNPAKQTTRAQNSQQAKAVVNDIPPYSIGIPKNRKDRRVCYLGYDKAYRK